MQAWFDFFAVIGAAAATLTGLLFVAMSMNAAVAVVYAAARMAWNGADMRDTLAGACIVLLFSATEKAWGLLNRIAAARK